MEYKLEFTVNEMPQVFYLNKDEVSIGKLRDNDLELQEETVSRQHFKLVRWERTYKLLDLKSTNGTYVNGQRVQEKVLKVGDKITAGLVTMTFLPLSSEESYQDDKDQQISLVMPLKDLERAPEKVGLTVEEPSFLASLTRLGKSLIASLDIEESFQKLAEVISEFIHPEKILIFYYDEKQNDLHLKYTYCRDRQKESRSNISKSIALKAIHEKVAILSSHTRNDARFDSAKSIIIYGITSALSVPIWTKDSIYGLIYIDTTSFAHTFGERDLEMMSLIANFAGFAIEGINSLEKLNRERKLRARLERYHSPAVVSKLLEFQEEKTGELAGYRESEASVLFLDIVNFTTRAEKMKPLEIGVFLNNFFSEMTEIIFKHNGTLDKYIGDGIMAVFGVPFEYPEHAELAIETALEMAIRVGEMNRSLPDKKRIQMRIGINAGKLISGDFGSPKRIEYTVLGNTVNIASRLEATVAQADEIVVSEAVYHKARNRFEFEALGEQNLQGISKPVKVYKVIGKRGMT